MSTQSELRQRQPRSSEHVDTGDLSNKGSALAHDMLNKGTVLKDQVCDACRTQFRHYPKLMVGVLLLSAFCLGIGMTALAGRMGMGPAATRWSRDPTAMEAHAALDTLLMHVNDAKHGWNSGVGSARDTLAGLTGLKAADLLKKGYNLKNSASDAADHAGEQLKANAAGLRGSVYGAAGDLHGNLGNAAGYAGEKLSQGADAVKHTATRGADYVSEQAHVLRDTLSEAATEASDALKHGAQELKYKVTGRPVPVETGMKAKLHQAEAKITELLHNTADTLKHGIGA